ncbi:ATPase, T2SS/T4P/T4SS family, partial [Neisseria dumasiana]
MAHDNSVSSRNLLEKLRLTEYLNMPGITEVFINRPGEVFLEGADGRRRLEREDLTFHTLEKLANTLCTYNKKYISHESPIHSVTLPDGERGHIMMPPSCEDGTMVFAFRKPSNNRFSLDDYINTGRLKDFNDVSSHGVPERRMASEIEIDSRYVRDVCDKMKLPHDVKLADWQYKMLEHKANGNLVEFFKIAIARKLNICMVGGTGSGKTTFTKALADLIPENERLITIE